MSSTIQQDNTPFNTQTSEYDRKDKICTKVMDETTLRIYFPTVFPKAANVDRLSLKSENIHTPSEKSTSFKGNDETINTQGQNLLLIILSPYTTFDEHTMTVGY